MSRDKIREVKPGEPITAEQYNLLINLAKRQAAGPGSFVDSTGTVTRPPPRRKKMRVLRVELKTALTPSSDGSPTECVAHPLADDGDGTYTVDTAEENELAVVDPTGCRRGRARYASGGKRGSYAWISALPDTWSGKYEILELEEIATRCKGTLTVSGRPTYASVNTVEPFNGLSPVNTAGEAINVYNTNLARVFSGTELTFEWDRDLDSGAGGWRIDDAKHQSRLIQVLLTEDMGETTPGQASIEAYAWFDGIAPDTYITVYDPGGLFPRALSGGYGKAYYDPLDNKYYLVECEQAATRCRALLDGALISSDANATIDTVVALNGQTPTVTTVSNIKDLAGLDNAACIIEFDDDDTNDWILVDVLEATHCTCVLNGDLTGGATATVDTVVGTNGVTPAPAITTVDNPENICGKDDAVGRIIGTPESTYKWTLVSCEHQARAIAFTLAEDMGETTPGQSNAATVDEHYDGTDPGETVTIYDPQGLYPRALDGAKGEANYSPETDKYIAVECQQAATRCRALLNGALLATDSTATIDTIVALNGQTPTVTTVSNVFDLAGDTNVVCVIEFDDADGNDWILVELPCTCVLNGGLTVLRVELKTALTPSTDGTATECTAHPLADDGDGTYTVDTDGGSEMTVIDPTGCRRGRARDTDGDRGSYAWVSALADTWTGKYEILELEPIATHCTAVLKGAISGSTGTVDGVVPCDGLSPVDESTDELTIANPHSLYGYDNAACLLTWHQDESTAGQYAITALATATHCTCALNAALTGGATVAVDTVAGTNGVTPSPAITLVDTIPNTCARDNAVGHIEYTPGSSNKWTLVQVARPATFIQFTLTASLATSGASSSAATVNNYWGGSTPGATETVYNQDVAASSTYLFEGAIGAKGIAVYDDLEDKYRIIQMECP